MGGVHSWCDLVVSSQLPTTCVATIVYALCILCRRAADHVDQRSTLVALGVAFPRGRVSTCVATIIYKMRQAFSAGELLVMFFLSSYVRVRRQKSAVDACCDLDPCCDPFFIFFWGFSVGQTSRTSTQTHEATDTRYTTRSTCDSKHSRWNRLHRREALPTLGVYPLFVISLELSVSS